jgi:hypothetical protein
MLAAMFMTLLTCTAFAAQNIAGDSYRSTKVVIIGGAEFKTQDYYKILQKTLGSKTKTLYDCGDEIQRQYQFFMMDRYDIGENKPRKQDMIDFAERNNYSSTLFLVLDENIDTQNNGKRRQKNRSTIQLDAYLVRNSRMADFTTTSQDFISKTSNLRARRGAFEKCLKEIATVMNLY